MTISDLLQYCMAKPGAEQSVHSDWKATQIKAADVLFAMIKEVEDNRPAVSLKTSPELAELLRQQHRDVRPSKHLNKAHWMAPCLIHKFTIWWMRHISRRLILLLRTSVSCCHKAIFNPAAPYRSDEAASTEDASAWRYARCWRECGQYRAALAEAEPGRHGLTSRAFSPARVDYSVIAHRYRLTPG